MNWRQFYNPCESAKRGGLEFLHGIIDSVLRELLNITAKNEKNVLKDI